MQKIDELKQLIEQQTCCSTATCRKYINWFNRQNILIQIDVFKEQKNQYFALKNKFGNSEIIQFSAFILGIGMFYEKIKKSKRKNKSTNIDCFYSDSNFYIKKSQKTRKKIKREKILNFWSEIQEMRAQNISFRQICTYIRQKHRFSVSHTYIQNIWKELKHESLR